MGRLNDIAPVYRDGEICPYFVMAKDSAEGVSLPDASKESILWAERVLEAIHEKQIKIYLSSLLSMDLVIVVICFVQR